MSENIEDLEREIDWIIFGGDLDSGLAPSEYNYSEVVWSEEILLDPSLPGKLEKVREIQTKIEELKSEEN